MMTVIDVEKKHDALRICDNLYDNGYILKLKNLDYDDEYAYINVLPRGRMIDKQELLALFVNHGFNAYIRKKDYYITLEFRKEVENLSAEECFNI